MLFISISMYIDISFSSLRFEVGRYLNSISFHCDGAQIASSFIRGDSFASDDYFILINNGLAYSLIEQNSHLIGH